MTTTEMQIEFSPVQQQALVAIADLLQAQKWPPSLLEIGKAAGIDVQAAAYFVRKAERLGVVCRIKGQARSIQMTPKGKLLVASIRRRAR